MIDPDVVYRDLPDIGCKGLCSDGCGPIACSAVEADWMRDAGVIPPSLRQHPKLATMCSHLTDEGRCAIYAHRPLICRLYGAVHGLRCQHGCKPVGGYLTQEQAAELLARFDDGRPPHRALPAGMGVRSE